MFGSDGSPRMHDLVCVRAFMVSCSIMLLRIEESVYYSEPRVTEPCPVGADGVFIYFFYIPCCSLYCTWYSFDTYVIITSQVTNQKFHIHEAVNIAVT